MRTCRDCPSTDLVPRGPRYFRNQCHICWAKTQRERWAAKRVVCLIASKANYQKHAEKRRVESVAHNKANPEKHALLEWFRRKGIPAASIPREDLEALISMKKAIKEAKAQARTAGGR